MSAQQGEQPEWREAAERARRSWVAAKNFRPEPEDWKPRHGRPRAVRTSERPTRRLALSPDEAAAALGVSRDFFDRHIAPDLQLIRRGRRKLVPVRVLDRWLENAAHDVLEGGRT